MNFSTHGLSVLYCRSDLDRDGLNTSSQGKMTSDSKWIRTCRYGEVNRAVECCGSGIWTTTLVHALGNFSLTGRSFLMNAVRPSKVSVLGRKSEF